jgi:hypothetical protein
MIRRAQIPQVDRTMPVTSDNIEEVKFAYLSRVADGDIVGT